MLAFGLPACQRALPAQAGQIEWFQGISSLLLQNVEPDGETDDQALDDQLVE
jgi:hypothetical protein